MVALLTLCQELLLSPHRASSCSVSQSPSRLTDVPLQLFSSYSWDFKEHSQLKS